MPPCSHSPQNELRDALGIHLRVCEPQRAAPRSANDQPSIDLQTLPQALDVRDEIWGVVAPQVGIRPADMWRASAAAPLIEQHHSICGWIEQPAMPRRATRTRPAVENERSFAARISA